MLLQINVSTKGKVCTAVYVDNTIDRVKKYFRVGVLRMCYIWTITLVLLAFLLSFLKNKLWQPNSASILLFQVPLLSRALFRHKKPQKFFSNFVNYCVSFHRRSLFFVLLYIKCYWTLDAQDLSSKGLSQISFQVPLPKRRKPQVWHWN